MSNSPDLSQSPVTQGHNHKASFDKYMDGFRINKHVIIYMIVVTLLWFMIWHFSIATFEYYNVSSQLIRGIMFAVLTIVVLIIAWRLK